MFHDPEVILCGVFGVSGALPAGVTELTTLPGRAGRGHRSGYSAPCGIESVILCHPAAVKTGADVDLDSTAFSGLGEG